MFSLIQFVFDQRILLPFYFVLQSMGKNFFNQQVINQIEPINIITINLSNYVKSYWIGDWFVVIDLYHLIFFQSHLSNNNFAVLFSLFLQINNLSKFKLFCVLIMCLQKTFLKLYIAHINIYKYYCCSDKDK